MSTTTTTATSRSSDTLTSASITTIVPPQHHVPVLFPELWLLVFPYLKPQDLRSVSLTSSAFRYMAQPHLFSVLDVSPFLLSYNAERHILRPRSYLERFKERLEYFQLPHVAHGVHHCWISPYTRSGFPVRDQQDDLQPNLIIDTVLGALPAFPNLITLSWHCIDITPEWWNIIQSLPLKRLWLNSSTLQPTSILPPLRSIIHLDLDQWPWEGRVTNHVSIHEERSPGVSENTLQHVIQPGSIQSISVPRADSARHLFSLLSQTTYDLRSLKIPFTSISDPNLVLALAQCPLLESLCIFPPSSDERSRDVEVESLVRAALPNLTMYEGPYSHVMQFSNQPLENIILWGFDDPPAICDPDKLAYTLTKLAETGAGDSLLTIKVNVVGITHDLMEVFGLFRRLESIVIQSQDTSKDSLSLPEFLMAPPKLTSLYELYAMLDKTTLPPKVRYVKMTTRLASPKLGLAGQEHEAARFMEAFARRHPMMQRIEIGYGIYWTGMYSAVWGRLRENTETHNDNGTGMDEITDDNIDSGYVSKSSSRDYVMSTVVSSVHPLPLGRLTFTEHRRTIFFPLDTAGVVTEDRQIHDYGEKRFFRFIWMRFRRLFGKPQDT